MEAVLPDRSCNLVLQIVLDLVTSDWPVAQRASAAASVACPDFNRVSAHQLTALNARSRHYSQFVVGAVVRHGLELYAHGKSADATKSHSALSATRSAV